MTEIVTVVAAISALIAGAARYWQARRRMNPAQRYVLVVLAGLSASLLLDVPMLQTMIADKTDVSYLARWLANATAMIAVFSARAMVVWTPAETRQGRGVRQLGVSAVAGLLVIGASALLLLGTDEALDPDLLAAMDRDRGLVYGQALFWSYMAACVTDFVLLMRRSLRHLDIRAPIHYSMVTVTLAGVVGVLWLVWNALLLITQHISGQLTTGTVSVSRTLGAAAVCLIAVGLTLPLWAPWIRRRLALRETRRTLHDLGPMWAVMTELVPTAAGYGMTIDDPEVQLYRKVIEIRDVLLRLMGHTESEIEPHVVRAEKEQGESCLPRPTTRVPACEIALAMENFRRGRRPADSLPDRPTRRVFRDIRAEAEWLIAVYRTMRSDSIVTSVVSDLLGGEQR